MPATTGVPETVGSFRRGKEMTAISSPPFPTSHGYMPTSEDEMDIEALTNTIWRSRRRRLSLWFNALSMNPFYFWFLSATDLIMFVYMAITLPLYFVRFSSAGWFVFHVAVLALIPCVRLYFYKYRERKWAFFQVRGVQLCWLQWLIDLYPIIIFFFMYSEISVLNQAIHKGRLFDDVVTSWEESLFDGQPSQQLRQLLPNKLLGEFFHFCYFSLYLIIASFPLGLLFTRDKTTFYKGVGSLCFTFYLGFIGFIVFPVEGPYWYYGPPNPSEFGYFFSRITHILVSGGSSNGTAFPSSHVGISVSCWILAYRHHKTLFKFYTLCVPGLVISTVYGGFHYAIDAICGLFMGIFCATVGHWIVCRIHKKVVRTRNDFRGLEDDDSVMGYY